MPARLRVVRSQHVERRPQSQRFRNHQERARAYPKIPPSVFVKVNIHSSLCPFSARECAVFTQLLRVVITTRWFPVFGIKVAAHSAFQTHAEGATIARERPAHLSVPTSKEP